MAENIIEVGVTANTAGLDAGLKQAQQTIDQSSANISSNLQPIQFKFDTSPINNNISRVGQIINSGLSNIRTTPIDVEFNSTELQSQVQQAGDTISDVFSEAREEADLTTEDIEQLGEAVANTGEEGAQGVNLLSDAFANLQTYIVSALGAVSVGGLLVLAKNTADTAKEIENSARLANTSTEEMQRQAYAAKTVGLEMGKLSDIYKDVNDKVGEYINNGGGELKDFFDNVAPKVGITAQQFQHLSGPQALQLYFNGLQKANLSQQQMTTYLEAIANDATALIPLLRNNGAEFQRLGEHADKVGIVLDEQAIAKSKALGASLTSLQATVSGFGSKLGSDIAPALTRMADSITLNIENSKALEVVTQKVVGGFEFFADNLEEIIDLSTAFAAGLLTKAIVATTVAIYTNIKATVQKIYADGQALIAAEAKAAADLQAARSLTAQTTANVIAAQAQVRATAGTTAHAAAILALADARAADRNATIAQTAAQNAHNASMTAGRFSAAGLLGVLGGPVGLAVLVGSVAAGYLLMGNNADSAKPKIDGLTGSIKDQVKQLKEMDAVQRNMALREAGKQVQQGNSGKAGMSVVAPAAMGFRTDGVFNYQNMAAYNEAKKLNEAYKAGTINFDKYYLSMQKIEGLTEAGRNRLDMLAKVYKDFEKTAVAGTITQNANAQINNPAYTSTPDTSIGSGGGTQPLDWQQKEAQEQQAKIQGIVDGSAKADPEVLREILTQFNAESKKQIVEMQKLGASNTQIDQYKANRDKEANEIVTSFTEKLASTYEGLADKVTQFEKKASDPNGKASQPELDQEFSGLKEAISKFAFILNKNGNPSVNYQDEASGRKTTFLGKPSSDPDKQDLPYVGQLQERVTTAYKAESSQIQIKTQNEITIATLQEEQKRNLFAIDLTEQRTKHEYDIGLLNNRELLAAAQEFERQRFAIKKESLEKQLELQKQLDGAAGVTTETKEQKQISTQITDVTDQNTMSLQGLNLQMEAAGIEATFGGLTQRMSSLWDQGIQSMMNGTLTWQNATNAIYAQMAGFFIQKLIQEPLQRMAASLARQLLLKLGFMKADTAATVAAQTMQTGAHVVGEATRTGVTATGVLTRLALKAGEAIKSIAMYAWEAMAGAFKAMVSIPIIGPALGVAAGVAAFALVAGLAGKIKSARGGYDIPSGVNPVTQLHEEEMVLPRPYANVIRGMASGNTANPASALQPAMVDGAGFQPQLNVSFNVQAFDSKDAKRYFKREGKAIADSLMNHARNFGR